MLRIAITIHLINHAALIKAESDHNLLQFNHLTDQYHTFLEETSRKTEKDKWITPGALDRMGPSTSCGGIIDANKISNGTIVFEGGENIRQKNLSCKWAIKTSPGQKIVGEFKGFSVGNSKQDCRGGDYIKMGAIPYNGKDHNSNGIKQKEVVNNKVLEKYESRRYCMGNTPKQEYQSIGDVFTLELMFQHQNRNLQADSSVDNIDQYKQNILHSEGENEKESVSNGFLNLQERSEPGRFTFKYWVKTNDATCGDKIQESQFYFRSPNYPSAIPNTTSNCGIKVDHDCANPVCQLRLDLLEFELAQPDVGDCSRDQFIMRADEPFPVLCGKNTGQHLFVDVRGRKETDINVMTTPLYPKPIGKSSSDESTKYEILDWLYDLTNDRKWNIRVTQIPCDCYDRPDIPEMEPAPAGCLQHFRGVTGSISSFNYDGKIRNLEPCYAGIDNEINCNDTIFTGHLNNLDYTICISAEVGYCGIAYTPKKEFVDGDLSWSGFQMDGTAYERRNPDLEFPPKFGESQCNEDYIQIPRGHHAEDIGVRYPAERYCGVKFGNRVEGAVISHTRPMIVRVKMDGQEIESGIATNDRGFNLKYQQIPCTASKSDAINFT